MEHPYTKKAVGLVYEDSTLLIAQISLKESTPYMIDLRETTFENVKPLDNDTSSLLTPPPLAAAPLGGSSLLLRKLQLPQMKNRSLLLKSVVYQCDPLLPYEPEEAKIGFTLDHATAETVDFTIYAAKQKEVLEENRRWQEKEVELDFLFPLPAALANLNKYLIGNERKRLFIHVADEGVTCALIQGDKAEQMFFLPLSLQRKSTKEDPQLKKAVVELRRIVAVFDKEDTAEIVLVGKGDLFEPARTFIQLAIQRDTTPFPKSFLFDVAQEKLQRFAVAIGVALTIGTSSPRPNLLPDESLTRSSLKKLKPALSLYGLTCLTLTCLMALSSFIILHQQKKQLLAKGSEIITLYNSQIPDQLKAKTSSSGPSRSLPQLLQQLQLTANPIETFSYPLAPDAPIVSEFLAWLALNPHFLPNEGPGLRLERLSYNMVQKPTKKTQKDRYRIRIDMDFTAETARHARDFHESLLKATDVISSKEEVQWNVRGPLYSTSFFLKDKTIYP